MTEERIRADQLMPGQKFYFSEEIGGENEEVTVESVKDSYGTLSIQTEEMDFTIDVLRSTMLTLVPLYDWVMYQKEDT